MNIKKLSKNKSLLAVTFIFLVATFFGYEILRSIIYEAFVGNFSPNIFSRILDIIFPISFLSVILTPVYIAFSVFLSKISMTRNDYKSRLLTSFFILQILWFAWGVFPADETFQARNSICITRKNGILTQCGLSERLFSTIGIVAIATCVMQVIRKFAKEKG